MPVVTFLRHNKIDQGRPLKSETSLKKLVFSWYVRIYERFRDGWALRRREALMPLKFKPKLNKIIELLLYLAHKRPGADKYQAVKFFYLADREHFRRYGRPITFEDYFALSYGPVASNALDFLNNKKWAFENAGIESLPFETEVGVVKSKSGKETETTFIRRPLRAYDPELFSETDLEVFDAILAEHGNASFDELFDLTHNHAAYKDAWKRRGASDRAEMFYDEMIDDDAKRREALVDDLGPIAFHMK
jgi:uncharacterized phage-associated protein